MCAIALRKRITSYLYIVPRQNSKATNPHEKLIKARNPKSPALIGKA
jgi:hypothetical protein